MQNSYLILADAMLALHTMIVLFIVVGVLVVWIGHFARWRFVRNFYFRTLHLLAMGYVSVQTLLGADCPLTVWENQLRIKAGVAPQYEETFVGYWLGKLLFYEIGLGVFAILYTAFFVLVVFTWIWVKPNYPAWIRRPGKTI